MHPVQIESRNTNLQSRLVSKKGLGLMKSKAKTISKEFSQFDRINQDTRKRDLKAIHERFKQVFN